MKMVRKEILELEGYVDDESDFCTTIGPMLAKAQVARSLAERFSCLRLLPIRVVKPTGRKAREMECRYFEFRPRLVLPPFPELSTVRLSTKCDKCGRKDYELVGIEQGPSEEKIGDRWEPVPMKPRLPGNGIVVQVSDLGGDDFFETHGFIICNETGREFIESHGWTNVCFPEYGEVIE
jgi:hypothetical protein